MYFHWESNPQLYNCYLSYSWPMNTWSCFRHSSTYNHFTRFHSASTLLAMRDVTRSMQWRGFYRPLSRVLRRLLEEIHSIAAGSAYGSNMSWMAKCFDSDSHHNTSPWRTLRLWCKCNRFRGTCEWNALTGTLKHERERGRERELGVFEGVHLNAQRI